MADTLQKQIADLVDTRAKTAFLFDFDGTLVDLVPHPAKVDVPPELVRDLRHLTASGDVVFAIVSGRPIAQIDRFLPGVLPTALGSHGAEFRSRTDGIHYLAPPMPTYLCDAIHALSDQHSCFFENKRFGLSFHLPFTHAEDDLGAPIAAALGKEADNYHVRKVGRTYEILQKDIHKGSGIRHLLRQKPFSDRTPVYVGDDTMTDESLQIIPQMGGRLVAARPLHHRGAIRNDTPLWSTEDVRGLVQALAHSDNGTKG